MGRLFGTDGARGVAITELTCELAMQIGRAAALVLTRKMNHKPMIYIGKDTRISSDILEAALAAGICSVGANAELLGVVPTPAVATLVRLNAADAGVMISASHNSVEFNGIKLFSSTGYKLSDEIEEEIEASGRRSSVMPSFSSRRAAGVPAGTVVTGRPERSVMRVTGAVVKAQTFFFRSSESGRSLTRTSTGRF